MKKHQKHWQRLLSWASFLGLLVNIIFPAGLVLAQAAPIGSLRTWENVITATSAEVHFSFSNAGYFRIDYGTTAGAYPLSSNVSTLTNTSYPYYSITVSGLSSNTTYYYRLATKALSPSTAEWGYTGESTFTTAAPDTTAPTVSGVSANYVTEASVNINYTLNESGYAKIEYGPNNSFTLSTQEYSVPAGGASTTGIGSLTAGTTYSYRIVARDLAGNSATSESYTFTTVSVVNCFVKVNGSIINSVIATDRNNCYTQTSFGSNNCSYYNSYFHEGSNTLEQYFGQTDRVNIDTCVKIVADTAPPSITGISANGVTAISANINFTLSEVANVKVEYGPSGTFSLSTAEASFPITPMSISLTGLTAGTAYSYRLVARDSANNSTTSGSFTFTTSSAPVTGCTGLTLTLTKSTYTVGENVNYTYTCTPSGTRAEYVAIQLLKPDQSVTTYNYATNIDTSTMGFSTSNLTVGTYTLRACFNSSCSPTPAASTSFTITSATATTDATAPAISGVYTSGVTSNSVYIYFILNEAGYAKVEYGPNNTFNLNSPELSAPGGASSTVYLSGLTPATTYSYRVVARDSANNSATSGSYTFTTASSTTGTTATTTPSTLPTTDTTPPVISGVHVMTNTSAYTQIMWSTDDLSYGRVEYDSTTAYGAATSWTTNLSYSPSVDITGLAPGKTYHYRVRAKNAAGLESVSTTDYTFVAGGSGETIPTIAFAVDPVRTYPQTGSYNVPVATPKIQVEFTKAIDTASVMGSTVYLGFLGSTAASLSGKLDVYNNGFNFILSEPLKGGVTYNFIVRGAIRASSGETLGGDYAITFTTAKATETTGQGVIKGTVKDSTGKSVAGAHVAVWSANYNFAQKTEATAYGEYVFMNLAPATYTVEVYPPAGSGGFTRPAPATVALGSGETAIRDFTFTASNATIKGVVKFSDSTPVTDAEVSAYRREGSGWLSSPVAPDGSYSLTVQVGSWMVSIRPRYVPYATAASSYPIIGGNSGWVYTQPPQEVYIATESDIRTVDFIVPKQTSTTSISGTLQRGDNEPITAGSASVRLLGQAGMALSVPVALDGRFTTPITPGNYKLYVDVTDPNLSSPEIPPVTIGPGEQKDIGLIVIPAATAVISGRVTTVDGRSVSGVKVSGWRANSADSAGALTDEQGNYNLKVSPGDWTVSLVSGPDQSYSNTAPPQFVRVKGGRVFGINFVLAPSDGIVNGLVTDEFGAILADFYGFVRVGSKNGYHLPGGSPVERGQFTLRLPAGSYILYMELPPNAGYGWPAPVPITVTTGESAKAVMKMATAASSAVIGYLVDRAGNKITNVPFKVYATGSSGGWFSALIDMSLGYYKLKVPAGTWYIGYDVADSSGQYQRPRDAKKKITVKAGAIASLDLPVVEQSGRVNGVVRDSEGSSIANIWVAISGQPFSKFGRETVAAQRYLNGATSDETGQFSLPVPPGVYYVRAFVPPSLGFTNPEEQTVRVAAAEETAVELVLRSIETTISGQTTIAGVPAWAFVWAWSNKGGYTESYADEKGNFKLKVSSGDIWHVGAMSEIKRDTYKASEVAINILRPGSSIPLSLDLAPLGVKLPELVNISSEADQMTVATNDVGAKLVVPANAASTEGALAVSITPEVITPSQGADRVVGFGYEFNVRNAAGQEINAFNSELTVSIPYDPRELSRLNLRPADLSLRYWDEINSTWQEVMNAIVDEINHVITGSLAHLTRFAIIAATDTTPPSAPASLKAKVAADGVVMTWVKPKDKDLQYMKVYRSTKKGALGEVAANNVKAATYKDSGLKRGATYYYVARAVDMAGNESTNTAAVAVGVKGKGTLGKAIARSAAAKVEKLNLKGSIIDINLMASTIEIKDSRGKKVVVKFTPKTTFKKDGKAVKAGDVKAGNTINAQATREGGVVTLVSAVITSVKVKVKAELKVSQFAGQRSKLKVKIIEAKGAVAGVGIVKGKEALLNIEGATVNTNGKSTPVEDLQPQKNVTIEGVVENGAVTVTKIITPPAPKVKVQPKSQGRVGDQAASVAR